MIYTRRMDKVFRRKYQRAKKGERKSEERERRAKVKVEKENENLNIKVASLE